MPFSLKQFLGISVDKVVENIGKAIDDNVTSDEERLLVKKDIITILTAFSASTDNMQKEVLLAELKGSKLQRSWRPILMLMFGLVIIFAVFFDVKLNEVPEDFWMLLKIGIGGYIGGRSIEKVTDIATTNMDISLRRKKNKN